MSKKYSDEELIQIFKDVYTENPNLTVREFRLIKDLPDESVYRKRFGSFKNTFDLAGINTPKGKTVNKLTNYSYDEIKEEFDRLIKEYLLNHVELPPLGYFNNSDFLSKTKLRMMYGTTTEEVYRAMGYDNYKEINEERIKEDLIDKYLEIKEILGHYPNSKELDKFTKNNTYYYSRYSYSRYFGSFTNFQKYINITPLKLGLSMTKEEIIKNLYTLKNELNYIPTRVEINKCSYLPYVNSILNKLNCKNITDLQLEVFGDLSPNAYYTENGTVCLSSYEYIIAKILEKEDYTFSKDDLYKKYIKYILTRHTVDFVVFKNNKYFFIEVFGMSHPEYNETKKWKIQLCKDNNIPLLDLYPKDISMSQFDELSDTIRKFVED